MHNLFIHGDTDLHRLLNREVDSIPVAYISTKYDVKKYPDLKGLFDQRTQFLYHSQEDDGVYLALCFSRIGAAQSKHGLPVVDVMSKTLKEVVSEDFSDDTTPVFSTITYSSRTRKSTCCVSAISTSGRLISTSSALAKMLS